MPTNMPTNLFQLAARKGDGDTVHAILNTGIKPIEPAVTLMEVAANLDNTDILRDLARDVRRASVNEAAGHALARANWRAVCGSTAASAAPSRRCRCQSSGRRRVRRSVMRAVSTKP